MDMSFQGLVSFPTTVIKLGYNPAFVPKRGPNAGTLMGPVLFINTSGAGKVPHPDVKSAIKAAINDRDSGKKDCLPADVTIYIDEQYLSLEDALDLDVSPYVFKNEGYNPGWQVQFLTDGTVAKTNGAQKSKGKKATKAVKKAVKKKGLRLY
jgi:hypothetical protein|tara:strand:+ start:113 stop:568 length:456 start_codon:yes stop_codon:yes gene_type:complete